VALKTPPISAQRKAKGEENKKARPH